MKQANFRKKAARRGPNVLQSALSHPSDFVPTTVVRRRLRFKATALSTGDNILQWAFGDLWCNTPTATTGFQLANYAKIHSIEIWGPMAADLVPVTASVEWTGNAVGAYGKSVRHSDTSMGASMPAHVKSVPPKGSQSAQWFSTVDANRVCTLAYPANSIVDVVLSLVMRDDGTATAVQVAPAGATVGAIYIRALNSPVNNNLVPLSNSTI